MRGQYPPRFIAGLLDRLHDQAEGLFIRLQVRRKPAFVTDRRVQPFFLQQRLERMEHLRRHPERLAETGRPHRHDHELLQVQPIVGMGPAVDDVHERHRQHSRIRPAQISIERLARFIRRRLRHSQRHTENGIGAELALRFRAIQLDHRLIDADLVERVLSQQLRCDRPC